MEIRKGMNRYMKKLLITGCNGQLGRALNTLYEGNREYELIMAFNGEAKKALKR